MKEDASTHQIDLWLDKKLFCKVTPARLIIFLLMGISLLLHMFNIGVIGDGNLYYTAAVKSMLQSWDNFFFASAEPGGSVTVDKPPLGLWIEALSAAIFGVNGFAVSLPNMLCGILSIPLLFHLVKKYYGAFAGIISGIVYLVTPIVLAANRNNTMDGMLVFTLLLAAWAFIKATDSGKIRFLILGSILIGFGFNIKMLQAYLVLPAFFSLFILGSTIPWVKKILYSFIAVIVILVISLSWALIVDLTPLEDRPYVGSSEDNTVMDLIIGHNGLARLFGKNRYFKPPRNPGIYGQASGNSQQFPAPQNNPSDPAGRMPPAGKKPGSGQPGQHPGANPFNKETGSPGIFRLFQAPLGKEMSWLLPFALFGMVMIAFSVPMSFKNMSPIHKGILLWGGWLLTCLVFFSMASFFHAYYMIMLAPPMAALVGASSAWFIDLQPNIGWKKGALVFAVFLTLIFQVNLALKFIPFSFFFLLPIGLFILFAVLLFLFRDFQLLRVLTSLILLLVLLIPSGWTIETISDDTPHAGLPSAFAGDLDIQQRLPVDRQGNPRQQALVNFLMVNTMDSEYLVAVSNAQTGAPFILATGRPVLYMGGFTGNDPVIDIDGIQEMVSAGELRYFFYQNLEQERDPQVREWLRSSCRIVKKFSAPSTNINKEEILKNQNTPILFDCH